MLLSLLVEYQIVLLLRFLADVSDSSVGLKMNSGDLVLGLCESSSSSHLEFVAILSDEGFIPKVLDLLLL